MKKIKITQKQAIALILVFLLGSLFYWYEWRPMKIRKDCARTSFKIARDKEIKMTAEGINSIKLYYNLCIWGRGIKK